MQGDSVFFEDDGVASGVRAEPSDQELAASVRRRAAEARAQLLELCRRDVNAFCEHVLRDDQTGEPIEQTEFHVQGHAALDKFKRVVIKAHPESGKALSLDTLIPTPSGWSTMGSLKVGDRVLASSGEPCSVTFATAVQHGRRVFQVVFEDGAVLTACSEHRWLARRSRGELRLATTLDLHASLLDEGGRPAWQVPLAEPVSRKLRELGGDAELSRWKRVTDVREVRSVPVRCISVDSPDRTYLAGRAFTVTHNTSQFAIGRVLWRLGRNPNLRVMLLNNAEDAAAKTLGAIKRYIEESAELREVFPSLRRGGIWKDDQIFVQRSAIGDRNPSVIAVGYNSKRIGGSRVDMLVPDDLLDAVVTATEGQRKKLSSWLKNTVLTRLTADAEVAFLTNAWHPRDLSEELVKERGWFLIKRPIRDTDDRIEWSRWTEARLRLVRRELGPLEFARAFECNPRDDEARVFRPEHVEHAKLLGRGYGFLSGLDVMPDNTLLVTGVDLAAGDDVKTKGARTALVTVFFHPNQMRQVVRVRSGRWRARQILDNIAAVGSLFPKNHWVVVENNGVQQYIVDLAQEAQVDVGVAIVPHTTGRNKADPRFGVASLSAEFEGKRWILPASCDGEDEQEMEGVESDLIDYVPEAHTGDKLMALWMAREIGRRIFMRFFGSGKFYEGSSARAIG